MSIKDGTSLHFTEINVIGNGIDAWKVEYGTNTSAGTLGTFALTTSSTLLNLQFTPTAATAMKIRVAGTLFAI